MTTSEAKVFDQLVSYVVTNFEPSQPDMFHCQFWENFWNMVYRVNPRCHALYGTFEGVLD